MENNHAPSAGYSALLLPVILFAAATSSVWVFQINDQQVKVDSADPECLPKCY